MKRTATFLFLVLLIAPTSILAQIPNEIIEESKASVVVIYGNDGAFQRPRGTGFIFNEKGDVLTNYHVCYECTKFWIRFFDGRKFEARRILVWESKDMTILRLVFDSLGDRPAFPYLKFNDTIQIQPGSSVATIGHSWYGLWQVIDGNVKTKNYYLKYQPTILYGFSGGPLINDRGYVVGMNIGSDNREVSVRWEGIYSSAIALNDIEEFLDYFYERKTTRPNDIFTDKKCVWQKTKEGQWCRNE